MMVDLEFFPTTTVLTTQESPEKHQIQAIIISSEPKRGKGIVLLSDGILRKFRFGGTLPVQSSFEELTYGYKKYGIMALDSLAEWINGQIAQT